MKQPTPIVYLVDDEPSVLKAVSRLLYSAGFKVETFRSPLDFLEEHRGDDAGCIVLDLSMPGIDGLALQETMAERGSHLPVIFLTGRADIPASVQAMKRGAVDFLTKPVDGEALIAAVRRALENDRQGRKERGEQESIRKRLALLTPREREVLEHVIAGKINRDIAAELGVVEKTVKVHRARVLEKMCVNSLADLVRLAQTVGIEPAP